MINLRTANDADKEKILQLFKATFGFRSATRAESIWHWRWSLDPRLEHPGYRGIVAEWQDRIIANAAFIPACLYLQGKPVSASWAVDVAVNSKDYRQALRDQRKRDRAAGNKYQRPDFLQDGLAATLMQHPSVDHTILTKHVSKQMVAVLLKINFHEIVSSGNQTRTVSYTPKLKKSLGKFLAPLVAWYPNKRLMQLPIVNSKIELLDGEFDRRFDTLWNSAFPDYSAICLRDSATLNWRYFQHPIHHYTTLTLIKGKELRGYVVVMMRIKSGIPQGKIIDLLTHSNDQFAVDQLMVAAISYLRSQGAGIVDCHATHANVIKSLQSLGFSNRHKPHPLIIRSLDHSGLFVMEGDGDGG